MTMINHFLPNHSSHVWLGSSETLTDSSIKTGEKENEVRARKETKV